MKPSPFWETKLKFKRQCLSEASLRNFRRNILSKHIDDNNDYDAFPDIGARVRQQWRALRKHIDDDLVYLVDDLEVGKPTLHEMCGHRCSVGSIEFAYLATRLRPFLRSRTCEIGGGYGGLARALLLARNHEYVMVDFLEVQEMQKLYLDGFKVEWLPPGSILPYADLYINTRSMFEMTLEQIGWYLERMLGPSHFFSVNRDKITQLCDWPIPKSWEKVDERASPMNKTMLEQTWRIPG